MDGLETQEGVIILAATNRPDVLDPALLRPGRFDRQVVLDLPDIKGRRKILDVHIKKIKVADSVDLKRIAKATPGFSGADLANLVNEAALLAARDDKEGADMHDFEEARDKVRWGRERRSRKISDKEREITAYHEAGHALVQLLTPDSLPVHKVTIIPRGQAYLGATMNLPEEDRYTQSRSELLDIIRGAMGGRVAEKIIFNEITSGAAQDIKEATRIARMMVCAFGMDEKLGVVQYGERSERIYVGRDITKEEAYSEETAREIDIAIKGILESCRSDAEKLLTDNQDKLEKLAKELLEKETLDGREIKELLGFSMTDEEKKELKDERIRRETEKQRREKIRLEKEEAARKAEQEENAREKTEKSTKNSPDGKTYPSDDYIKY
jgi:cell division protease FtsH